MSIYLLVKEHAYTGLKYLCMHVADSFSDCEKYKGSGVYWRKHLKKHGKEINTKCIFVTEDMQEFRKIAKKYSLDFDVIKSKSWANLCDEEGLGGNTVLDRKAHGEKTKLGLSRPEVKEKMRIHLEKHIKIIQPLAASAAKIKLKNVDKTEEHKQNMRGKRPHVNQIGSNNNNAKKIITPFGDFDSIRDASNNIDGYTYKMIWDRLQSDTQWRYCK